MTANQEIPAVLFCQKIKFDRSKGTYGDLYANMKNPVLTCAIMVVKSNQDSIMVRKGFPYLAFITCNEDFRGVHPGTHFFATSEEAIEFAKSQCVFHKLIA